jgi:signal peptidase II
VALLILLYFPSLAKEGWVVRLAIALQFGGALGNLVDRIRLGHVTDWISIGEFPVFNVADSAITFGVVILLITLWTDRERPLDEPLTE